MANKIMQGLEWASRAETVSALIHSDFARNWLWPVASTLLTGTTGVVGGVPAMWVMVGSSVVFMTVTMGMVANLALKERNTPQNKLITKPMINRDLTPCHSPLVGNRRQRLAQKSMNQEQMLSSSQVMVGVNRTLDKIQLGIEITNTALFPISCILVSADTEIEGEKPPRSNFPKPPAICPPGNTIRMLDNSIPMDEFPCQRLSGKMDFLIRYGLPKNETFELRVQGGIDVMMEGFGFVNAVALQLA